MVHTTSLDSMTSATQRGYFCTGTKEMEENLVPEMQSCKILDEILIAVRRVSRLASSLIFNVANNSCEQFNSVVNKFINGKRVNYSLRGSYTTRRKEENPPVKRKKVPCGPDQDYGLLEEEYPLAMDDEQLVTNMKSFINNLSLTEVQRNQLERDTVEQISCPKCTKAMQYGIDNEPFAKAMLQLHMNIDVTNCGLFVDQDQPFLAVSPDGLVGDDEIVEIKCPLTISDSEDLSSAAASEKV
uniref:YqaJ viral recombinase domain-containing protein n=1 Tax=Timema tahoe TaxID=61484 RepID=A0A7R9IUE6_9NEOP|nr:unnamed protein product [Timema tahoe]